MFRKTAQPAAAGDGDQGDAVGGERRVLKETYGRRRFEVNVSHVFLAPFRKVGIQIGIGEDQKQMNRWILRGVGLVAFGAGLQLGFCVFWSIKVTFLVFFAPKVTL